MLSLSMMRLIYHDASGEFPFQCNFPLLLKQMI